jgi:spore maturation protein CgeB
MKIAFFGSSILSAYWNGAATYYRGIIRALHARGHEVTFYEPDAYDRQSHRDIGAPEWVKVVVYENHPDAALQALENSRAADLIIKASGVGVFDELLEEAVLGLKSEHRLVAFWDVDAPATLERVEDNADDPFRRCIPEYDVILTYGGGRPVIEHYQKLGADLCVPIYNALDPSTHYPVPADPRYAADLSFLGNRLPDRESRVEEFFLCAAEKLPERKFLIGGSGWEDKSMPSNVHHVGHVFTAAHNAFNCSARAVLNVSRASMARYGFSPATRVFEAAGAGACVITDAWEGVEDFFEPGEEILVAQSGGEVADLLEKLRKDSATSIGRLAYRRVLADHTYAQRAALFEDVIDANIIV